MAKRLLAIKLLLGGTGGLSGVRGVIISANASEYSMAGETLLHFFRLYKMTVTASAN